MAIEQKAQAALHKWLDTLSPPRLLQGKREALRLEVEGLEAVIERAGVKDERRVDAAFRHIKETAETRSWPTAKELLNALSKSRSDAPVDLISLDPVDIHVRRVQRGDAIGDGWFYGTFAVELLKRGITEGQLDAYRSAAWFRMTRDDRDGKRPWTEGDARTYENALKFRHDEALRRAGMAPRYRVNDPHAVMEAAE